MTGEFLPVGCISSCLLPYSQHAATVPTHHHSLLQIYALFKEKATASLFLIQARCLFCSNLVHRSTAWECGITGWAWLVWRQPHTHPVPYTWLAPALCQQDGPTRGSPAALTQCHVSLAAGALSTAVAIDTLSYKLGKLFSSSSNSVFL